MWFRCHKVRLFIVILLPLFNQDFWYSRLFKLVPIFITIYNAVLYNPHFLMHVLTGSSEHCVGYKAAPVHMQQLVSCSRALQQGKRLLRCWSWSLIVISVGLAARFFSALQRVCFLYSCVTVSSCYILRSTLLLFLYFWIFFIKYIL